MRTGRRASPLPTLPLNLPTKSEIILIACSKCDWRAAFSRDDLIATHGASYAMPNLLDRLAAAPVGTPWLWTLASGQHEDPAMHGYERTREAAMAVFAKSWRRK